MGRTKSVISSVARRVLIAPGASSVDPPLAPEIEGISIAEGSAEVFLYRIPISDHRHGSRR